jgi:hypothetical protein
MRETAAAAAINADALYGVTAKLLAAKAEIAALLEQRLSYVQAEQQMIEHTRAVTRLPGTPIQAPPPEPQRPPDNWWDHLDRRARNVMAESDAAIATDAARFQTPRRYDMIVDVGKPPRTNTGAPLSSSATQDSVPALPSLDPDSQPSLPAHGQLGGSPPVLEGRPLPSTPTPTPAANPKDAPSITHTATSFSNQGIVGAASALPPSNTTIGGRVGATLSNPPSQGATGSARPVTTSGKTVATQGTLVPPPMIGRPTSSVPASVAPGGRPGSAYGRRRPKDPNDPWAVKDGVPPLLEPPTHPTEYDPGPGVIGLDR